MAKRQPQKIPIFFNYPYDDKDRMSRILENGKMLLTMDYQYAYNSLPIGDKEEGFKILEQKFKEQYGQKHSLRLIQK